MHLPKGTGDECRDLLPTRIRPSPGFVSRSKATLYCLCDGQIDLLACCSCFGSVEDPPRGEFGTSAVTHNHVLLVTGP